MLCSFLSHSWNGRWQDFYTLSTMRNYSTGIDTTGIYSCG